MMRVNRFAWISFSAEEYVIYLEPDVIVRLAIVVLSLREVLQHKGTL